MIGNKIIQLLTVDSTNNYAQYLLANELQPEGTLIVSTNQISGRGMHHNTWQSEKEMNLTFSIILYPEFVEFKNIFALNQFVSLAVCSFINELTGLSFKVKWPNDIMFDNQKICGILIENNIRGNRIQSCIVGIGININQTSFPDFTPKATSLKMITSKNYDLNETLKLLCNKLDEYYTILKQGDYRFLIAEYHQNLFRYNEEHLFKRNETYFKGVIKGVQADGKLLIADEFNTSSVIDVKEIQYVY